MDSGYGSALRFFALLLAAAFSIAAAVAPGAAQFNTAANGTNATLRSLDIEIALNSDGSANWRVELAYTAPVQSVEYLVLLDVEDLSVKSGGRGVPCSAENKPVGTLLSCANVDGSLIVYSFRTPDVVRNIGPFRTFAYTFNIAERVDFFALKISLPLGSVLADPSKLQGTGLAPFKPYFGKEGSNGRQILVSWELASPRTGDAIDASVLYEAVAQAEIPPSVWLLVALALSAAGFAGWKLYLRSKPERLLPALGDRERPVMELIIRHKLVDQRDIVRALGWPKAKVSRAIRVLADRGLVEALPKGRTKELRLIEQTRASSSLLNRILSFRIKHRAKEMGLSRGQAVELVQTAITPLIDWAERVLHRLHANKFGFAWDETVREFLLDAEWKLPLGKEQRERHLNDIKNLAPELEERLTRAEKSVSDVEKALEKVKDRILANKKFQSACRAQKENGIRPEHLVRHVIDKDRVVNDAYAWSRFWNARSAELIKAAEDASVRKSRNELAQVAAKAAKAGRALKEELERVREQLRRQYHILYKEYRV